MAGIVVNPKTEVLRLSATKFRKLPLWSEGYELAIEICQLVEKDSSTSWNPSRAGTEMPATSKESMRQLALAAMQIPKGLARSASYRQGKNHVIHLRKTFTDTRQLAVLLLLCYNLDNISSERFVGLNSKINIFSKKLFRYIRICEIRQKKKNPFRKSGKKRQVKK